MSANGGFGVSLALAAVISVFAICTPAGAQQRLPVEAFGSLPRVADVAISPDGTKLVVATQAGNASVIDVIEIDTGRRIPLASIDSRAANQNVLRAQLRGVDWADNTRVTFAITETVSGNAVGVDVGGANDRIDYYRPGVIDLVNPRPRFLSVQEDDEMQRYDGGAALIAPIQGDPGFGRIVNRSFAFRPPRVIPFRVNLANGAVSKIDVAGANVRTAGFVLAPNGEVLARADIVSETNRWSLYRYHNGQPFLITEGVSDTGAPDTSIEGALPDGRLLLMDEKEDPSTIYAMDRATGARERFFHREGQEVGVIRDRWTGTVIGAVWTGERTQYEYFDPAMQAARDAVRQSFPDSRVSFAGWSADRSRIIVYREDGLDGGGFYIYTPANQSMRRVAMRYPELAAAGDYGQRTSITYRARDGTRIPAYLSLPVGDPRNLPLVVLPHGGPHGVRDDDGFDWWSSFLVSRGYAVLQPNYRGSGGYGREWMDAGKLQWGGLMQTDVEDGVTAMIRSGMVDASRVCIVGASYGGYAALAGATLTPDRYACAVSVAGVSDLQGMLRHTAQRGGRRGFASDFWRLSIGDRLEDLDRIRSVSPANLAERVRIPVLLIHGRDDTVVPYEQSTLMDSRMRAASKNVRLITLENDDHWLSDGPTRIQMLRELETFLAQHIGPR